MNKFSKILLAILAGVETVFYMITPILIAMMWIRIFSFGYFSDNVVYMSGLLASVFRGIKVGWLKR